MRMKKRKNPKTKRIIFKKLNKNKKRIIKELQKKALSNNMSNLEYTRQFKAKRVGENGNIEYEFSHNIDITQFFSN